GGPSGLRPCGGLKPTRPEADAGMRIEPPISVPVASVVKPAASAAPEPPDEPPGPKSRFHGLRVTPQMREWQTPDRQNSGVVVRPWTMAPAASSRSIIGSE